MYLFHSCEIIKFANAKDFIKILCFNVRRAKRLTFSYIENASQAQADVKCPCKPTDHGFKRNSNAHEFLSISENLRIGLLCCLFFMFHYVNVVFYKVLLINSVHYFTSNFVEKQRGTRTTESLPFECYNARETQAVCLSNFDCSVNFHF